MTTPPTTLSPSTTPADIPTNVFGFTSLLEFEEALADYNLNQTTTNLHEIGWYYDKTLKDYENAQKYYELNISEYYKELNEKTEGYPEDKTEKPEGKPKEKSDGLEEKPEKKPTSVRLSIYNLADIIKVTDRDRAIKLLESIIDEDNDALYNLGHLYRFTEPDKTLQYWQKAIDNGDGLTMNTLGDHYRFHYSKVVKHDPVKAFEMYLKAAESGYVKAWIKVSDCYMTGTGVGFDEVKEIDSLLRVPEKDLDQIHLYNLGYYNYKGLGKIQRDYIKAFRIFKHLDETFNDRDAQHCIGEYYEYGHGECKRDKVEAKKWYKKSADNKDIVACQKMVNFSDDDDEVFYYLEQLLTLRINDPKEAIRQHIPEYARLKYKHLDKLYKELSELRIKCGEYDMRPPLIGGKLFREAQARFNKITSQHEEL